ncbi:ABC transporter transmembrane domain-containing protein [Chitinibacter sp. ZOR0017]|uniref:ABC transporter transmembrane domain-containing protein n=1 Tax=Chitinibacter sp. ZOR0017 TaxID=1339254 RepID=UPI000648E055|nr:ABC transporter transmembrane domain-containing protein [Chitinibacter sp. ZOR0017]
MIEPLRWTDKAMQTRRTIHFTRSAFLASVVIHTLGLALPLALLQIYDRILPAQAYGTATFLVLGVALAIVLEALLRFGRSALFANLGMRYEVQTTLELCQRLQSAPIAQLERIGTAQTHEALRSVQQVRDFWSGAAAVALYEVPFALLYIGLIAYLGGWLAAIPLLLFILAIGLAGYRAKQIQRYAAATAAQEAVRNDFLWTAFTALPYVKSIAAEYRIAMRWRQKNADYFAANAALEAQSGAVRENAILIGQLSTILVVTLGAVLVLQGQLTTGALAACSMLAGRSIGPAMASLGFWAQWSRTGEAQSQVDQLLALPPQSSQDGVEIRPKGSDQIELIAPAYLSIPLALPAGQVIAVKSNDPVRASDFLHAVASLVSTPNSSSQTLATTASSVSPVAMVAMAGRQVALVPGTIRDNLLLFDESRQAQLSELMQALDFDAALKSFALGLHTPIGAVGAETLNQGIVQRIGVLRALLQQPRLLLLDHAAIGIDLGGLKQLADYLAKQAHGTTVLLVSNQPELLAVAQQIITLDNAEVGHD